MHGNSNKNPKEHHLYEIKDQDENDTFKYGISADQINADGKSPRAESQVKLFNILAGKVKYCAEILLKNIMGQEAARKIEKKHIKEYESKHGQKPKGNLRD